MVLNGIFGNDAYDLGVGHQAMFSKQSELWRQRVTKENSRAPFGEFGNAKRLSMVMKTPWTMENPNWLGTQGAHFICAHPQRLDPKVLALGKQECFKNKGPNARQRMLFSNMSWNDKLWKGRAVEQGEPMPTDDSKARQVYEVRPDTPVAVPQMNTGGFGRQAATPGSPPPTARPMTPAVRLQRVKLEPVSRKPQVSQSSATSSNLGNIRKGLALLLSRKNSNTPAANQVAPMAMFAPLPGINKEGKKARKNYPRMQRGKR